MKRNKCNSSGALPPTLLAVVISATLCLAQTADAFCQTGCKCADENRSAVCENVTSIPILLHPMLKSLTVRNSPSLKLDSVSIGLYQELESLELSRCNIESFPDGLIGSLKNLRELRLSGNRLKALDVRTFSGARSTRGGHNNFQILDLSDNELERIAPNAFCGIDPLGCSLAFLNLSGNQLHQLHPSQAFAGLGRSLKVLDLSRNRLAKMDGFFFNETPALIRLDLAGNILSELPANAFASLRHLTHLSLGRNLIVNVDESAFYGLQSLKALDLTSNLLSSISGLTANWRHMVALERLHLSANLFAELPMGGFRGLSALRELSLRQMAQLQRIRVGALSGLALLEILEITDSPLLSTLPAQLFIEDNDLSSISAPQLRRLDLSNNQLSRLDAGMLADWYQLRHLNLVGNRWRCNDCAMADFLPGVLRRLVNSRNFSNNGNQDVVSDVVVVVVENEARCTQPEWLFNTRIVELYATQMDECKRGNVLDRLLFSSDRTATHRLVGNDALMSLLVVAALLAVVTIFVVAVCTLLFFCWRRHTSAADARHPRKGGGFRNTSGGFGGMKHCVRTPFLGANGDAMVRQICCWSPPHSSSADSSASSLGGATIGSSSNRTGVAGGESTAADNHHLYGLKEPDDAALQQRSSILPSKTSVETLAYDNKRHISGGGDNVSSASSVVLPPPAHHFCRQNTSGSPLQQAGANSSNMLDSVSDYYSSIMYPPPPCGQQQQHSPMQQHLQYAYHNGPSLLPPPSYRQSHTLCQNSSRGQRTSAATLWRNSNGGVTQPPSSASCMHLHQQHFLPVPCGQSAEGCCGNGGFHYAQSVVPCNNAYDMSCGGEMAPGAPNGYYNHCCGGSSSSSSSAGGCATTGGANNHQKIVDYDGAPPSAQGGGTGGDYCEPPPTFTAPPPPPLPPPAPLYYCRRYPPSSSSEDQRRLRPNRDDDAPLPPKMFSEIL